MCHGIFIEFMSWKAFKIPRRTTKRIKKKHTCVVTKKGTKDVYEARFFLGKIMKQMKSVFIIFPCLVFSPFFHLCSAHHQLSLCIIPVWDSCLLSYDMARPFFFLILFSPPTFRVLLGKQARWLKKSMLKY